ncbi:hypothetical protein AAC387_Pa05g0917 [Persea americana]
MRNGNGKRRGPAAVSRRQRRWYQPDKNVNGPKAAEMFKDPDKRWQYDTAGFEAIESESQELELDLSSLGAVNTMHAACFSKLGVPIKMTVSVTVLEVALNGLITVRQLQPGQPICRKVEKQCDHFYFVTITKQEAHSGFECRVVSPDKSILKSDDEMCKYTAQNLNLSVIGDSEKGIVCPNYPRCNGRLIRQLEYSARRLLERELARIRPVVDLAASTIQRIRDRCAYGWVRLKDLTVSI